MKFEEIPIKGSCIITTEKNKDNRGFFARTFDKKIFFQHSINFNIIQTNISCNKKKGTVRGMHYQVIPYSEAKIVQCIKGSIQDVILDLRPYSKTYHRHFSVELSDKNHKMLYIPAMVAHGFQTLEDDTTLLYYMNEYYYSDYSKTLPYNSFNIKWRLPVTEISEKDKLAKFEVINE